MSLMTIKYKYFGHCTHWLMYSEIYSLHCAGFASLDLIAICITFTRDQTVSLDTQQDVCDAVYGTVHTRTKVQLFMDSLYIAHCEYFYYFCSYPKKHKRNVRRLERWCCNKCESYAVLNGCCSVLLRLWLIFNVILKVGS